MKKQYATSLLLLLAVVGYSHKATGQDLVYRAKNPAFGGDTFNYQWLQSSATAQNSTRDPAVASAAAARQDPLQQFQQSLNQQILGLLAQRIVSNQFGSSSGALQPGSYNVGVYRINVTPNGTGFSVQITDTGTGNQTTIAVPGL